MSVSAFVVRVFIITWKWGMGIVAVFGVGLGLLSLVNPQRSIRLYQAIMVRFNWRVTPINAAQELRNTRILGSILVLLSSVDAWLLTR
ncbi:MAG: hypothetical protein HYY15_01785 [Candidatus Omnitrophica bacterium]|nr:hypothetical protein [Candidatus Omnitrophota bacterium]